MNVLMCGETIPSETLYGGGWGGGLNKWSIDLTHLSQRSVAVSHSIIHIAVSYGNSTIMLCNVVLHDIFVDVIKPYTFPN